MKYILLAKTLLDAVAAVGFAYRRNWPLCLMFAGFALADLATLWLDSK